MPLQNARQALGFVVEWDFSIEFTTFMKICIYEIVYKIRVLFLGEERFLSLYV
jgi:hypothetical protein